MGVKIGRRERERERGKQEEQWEKKGRGGERERGLGGGEGGRESISSDGWVRPTLMNFRSPLTAWYFRYTTPNELLSKLRPNSDRVRSKSDGVVEADLCVHSQ